MTPPVFILSIFDTGYYVARLLKKSGASIYGFDHEEGNPGFYSKYIKSFLVPHPLSDPNSLKEILLEKCKDYPDKPILFPASEIYLEYVYQHRLLLEKYFLFLIPDNQLLGKIINKQSQFELAEKCGLDVPTYTTIRSTRELQSINIEYYPVVIKGEDQPVWKSQIKQKSFIAHNEKELLQIGADLLELDVTFIVQQIIQGNCTNNYEFNALYLNGEFIEKCMTQKIRQYPIDFGYGCCVTHTVNEEIEYLGSKFVKENNISGFSNTEFKRDPKTGKYYFIETNARVWQQIELTQKAGQNFALTYYGSLIGKQLFEKEATNRHRNLRWIDLPTDLLVFLRYRHIVNLTAFDFLKSLFNATNFGLLSLKDMRPFLTSIGLIKKMRKS